MAMLNPNMSDAEQLAQLMQGNLKGQLSSGDRLSALGALLKSVSRGSQTSPQQVMQQLQQQKMQEVQGRIQIAELQKQAARQAQTEKLRQDLINSEQDPRRKALLAMASAEDIGAIAREQFKNPEMTSIGRGIIESGIKFGTPAFTAARQAAMGTPTAIQTAQGTQIIPGVTIESSSVIDGKNYVKIGGNWYLAE